MALLLEAGRRREASDDVFHQPGQVNRRSVLQVGTDDLYTDWQSARGQTDGGNCGRQIGHDGQPRPGHQGFCMGQSSILEGDDALLDVGMVMGERRHPDRRA